MTKAAVAKLLALPADERADLAATLWNSLSDGSLALSAEEELLIDQRLAEAAAQPEDVLPWATVRAEIWPDS